MNISFLSFAMSTSSMCFEMASPTVSTRTELLGKVSVAREPSGEDSTPLAVMGKKSSHSLPVSSVPRGPFAA